MIDFLELVGCKGIILNPTKFQFAQKEIDFAGFHITQEDTKPLDKYLETIRTFPQPKNVSDIRAWFGLVNQVSHYSKLTDLMKPFEPSLSPKTPFLWTEELEHAFEQSKIKLIKAIEHGVRIFDPLCKTCLTHGTSRPKLCKRRGGQLATLQLSTYVPHVCTSAEPKSRPITWSKLFH